MEFTTSNVFGKRHIFSQQLTNYTGNRHLGADEKMCLIEKVVN